MTGTIKMEMESRVWWNGFKQQDWREVEKTKVDGCSESQE